MQPFSPHNRFFSSLDQLQSRLSSESQSKTQNPQPPPESNPPLSSSSSSPLFITTPKPHHQPTSSSSSSSGPPLDFLSGPPATQHQETDDDDGADDIETLMGLLGLSTAPSPETPASCSCDCSGAGFYKNVVGVGGPRCERERGRLDGWIDLYRRERAEPARLAHLMIGKAVTLSLDCGGGGFEGAEFPATVEEFLERDP